MCLHYNSHTLLPAHSPLTAQDVLRRFVEVHPEQWDVFAL